MSGKLLLYCLHLYKPRIPIKYVLNVFYYRFSYRHSMAMIELRVTQA